MKAVTTLLVFCVGALLSLGLVMLYSAGMLKEGARYEGAHYLLMQLIWGGMGVLIAGLLAAVLDYRWVKKCSWPLLVLSIACLVLVLAIGVKTNGARRWLRFGPFNFQPSELAKLALIVAVAYYGDRYQRFMSGFGRGLVVPGLIISVVLGLVFVEPDRGTTVLLAMVGGIMLVLAGTRLWFIFPPLVIGATSLAYCLWEDPVRRRRILSWLDPESHKQDAGYQVWRSMVGIGSGGVEGLGLGNGRQKAFVPERHTDFIFSVVGEELGLIATLATIVAFIVLMFCGIYIARRARDTFGFLLASGITFLIGLQSAINIGVVTGALPNKGLPLPFVSYGGSNLLLMLCCVGILLSIARQARGSPTELIENEPLPEGAATQLGS
jgi:cell division protein FtsW